MSNRLSTKQLNELWRAFQEKQENSYVAKQCGVTANTVKKYRISEKWDDRFKVIQEKAVELADRKSYVRRSENLTVVRYAKSKLVEKIKSGKDKSQSTYSELDKLIRLEEFLSGEADSHVQQTVRIEFVDPEDTEHEDKS